MKNLFESVIEQIPKQKAESNDYRDESGLLMCGKCHTRKELEIEIFGKKRIVGTMCKCKIEAEAEEKRLQKEKDFFQRMEKMRKDGISDPQYLQYKFENDDLKEPKFTNVCKKYVDKWEDMKSENMGILFNGTVGTGKSFLACCIANALIEKLVPVCITNFPRVMNKLQGLGDEKQVFIDNLQRYDLLIIDDLGVERNTSYAAEQVYNIIDTRNRSGKPTIITTNLFWSSKIVTDYSKILNLFCKGVKPKLKV